jgi:hypothetical protein
LKKRECRQQQRTPQEEEEEESQRRKIIDFVRQKIASQIKQHTTTAVQEQRIWSECATVQEERTSLAISTCQLSRRRSKRRKDPSIVPLK